MRILFLSDDFPPDCIGGAGLIAFTLAKGINIRGHKLDVITVVDNKSKVGTFEYEGLIIHRIYSNYPSRLINIFSLYNPFILRKIKKLIKEIDPDVIHAHNIHYRISYSVLKLSKKLGKKVFLTAHDAMSISYGKLNNYFDIKDLSVQKEFNYKLSFWHHLKTARKRYNPFRNILIKHYLKYTDKIFAITSRLKNVMEANGISNIDVVHYGINLDGWLASEDDINSFKTKYNLVGKRVILFGGRLSPLKGGELMIRTLKLLVKKDKDILFLIAGTENDYAKHLLKLAEKLNIRENIVFTGWIKQKDLAVAYGASAVVITPSIYFDAFNLFNIEAMAAGKPVVGTCFGGTPEIIEDGKTGVIVNPHNIDMMSDKIYYLLNNDEIRTKMGKQGVERVKNYFTLKRYVDDTLSYYNI
jgi:glycosyltransferase involved in cell wall biosynthesis